MNHQDFKKFLLQDEKFRKKFEDKSDIFFEIAKSVKELRIKHGLTQTDLAKKIKAQQESIARIENPKYSVKYLKFLEKIAKAFNTELIPPKFKELEADSCGKNYTRVIILNEASASAIFNNLKNTNVNAQRIK